MLFRTGKDAGQHLGPGSYDLPCALKNGERSGRTHNQVFHGGIGLLTTLNSRLMHF